MDHNHINLFNSIKFVVIKTSS